MMFIRQAAFAKGKPFQKGCLHCHTTRSDGDGDPVEVMKLYAKNGYDFMALTDHNIFNRKNYAPGELPTVLSGIERDMQLPGPAFDQPFAVHVLGIGDPESKSGPAHDEKIPNYGRFEKTIDAQEMIDQMKDWGLLTVYAHPEWSGTCYEEFKVLHGYIGMEIHNATNVRRYGQDPDAIYWDQALNEGNNLWGFATDDSHAMCEHCKGFVMVSSENNPHDLLEALKKGEFYSSCGPVIRDFCVEDGKAFVKCSPAKNVRFVTMRFPLKSGFDPEGKLIEEAQCRLPEGIRYVRAVVTDEQGKKAWTNPIILR